MTTRQSSFLHPAIQLLLLIAMTVIMILVGGAIAVTIIGALYGTNTALHLFKFDPAYPNFLSSWWILQLVSTTLPILLVPVFFARVVVRDAADYLKPSFSFPPVLLVLAFCIMLFSSPIMEVLTNINHKMVLPDSLKSIEQWMREKENQAQKIQALLLRMNTIFDLLRAILIVAVLTAIAEEFMFRGCIQTMFQRWGNNKHVAVWVTAIIFSAFHMEFFGFLPRLFLGVLFGYFVVWSGSIWPAVLGHFVNNGTAVVVIYLYQHKQISVNPNTEHVFSWIGFMVSLIITVFLLFIYRRIGLARAVRISSNGKELG